MGGRFKLATHTSMAIFDIPLSVTAPAILLALAGLLPSPARFQPRSKAHGAEF